MDMIFILRTLAQVGAHPKEKEKPQKEPLDVLLLGHHLKKVNKVIQTKSEAQSISSSSPSRVPGPACSKMNAHDTSGLRF